MKSEEPYRIRNFMPSKSYCNTSTICISEGIYWSVNSKLLFELAMNYAPVSVFIGIFTSNLEFFEKLTGAYIRWPGSIV